MILPTKPQVPPHIYTTAAPVESLKPRRISHPSPLIHAMPTGAMTPAITKLRIRNVSIRVRSCSQMHAIVAQVRIFMQVKSSCSILSSVRGSIFLLSISGSGYSMPNSPPSAAITRQLLKNEQTSAEVQIISIQCVSILDLLFERAAPVAIKQKPACIINIKIRQIIVQASLIPRRTVSSNSRISIRPQDFSIISCSCYNVSGIIYKFLST